VIQGDIIEIKGHSTQPDGEYTFIAYYGDQIDGQLAIFWFGVSALKFFTVEEVARYEI